MLASLATALRLTTDELLGLAPLTETMRPRTARLMKHLQQIEELPAAEQRAVLKMVDLRESASCRASSSADNAAFVRPWQELRFRFRTAEKSVGHSSIG